MKKNSKKSKLADQYEQQSNVFQMWLLFDHEPKRPDPDILRADLEQKCGRVDVISSSLELTSFGVRRYTSHFKEGNIPAQIMLGNIMPFRQDDISGAERAQIREIQNRDEFLGKITHKVLAADMMAALDAEHRTKLLMDWLEVAVNIMPDCKAVWIPSGGKLIPAELIRSARVDRADRFVCYAVNARYYSIKDTEEMLVDTHGMCAVGLPDVQCHFKNLNPNDIINYVYNIAAYICQSGQKIKDGDTIDGLKGGEIDDAVQWICRYEDAMVQPMRAVIDICPGEYAAGERN